MHKQKIINSKEINVFVIERIRDALLDFRNDKNDSSWNRRLKCISNITMP